jgi:CubicO group peptidase (beta-lactamase class C family)
MRAFSPLLLFLFLLIASPANPAAQALSQADRQRIESYGAIYIRALNSGATESYSKAIQEVFAEAAVQRAGEARLVGQMDRVHRDFGEMDYHHSEIAEFKAGGSVSYVLHVYARSKGAKNWNDMQFRLEAVPPHKIKELAFIANVAEPVYLPYGAITDSATIDWLNRYIDKLIADNELYGSVLIAKGDTPIFERVYGFADDKRATKVTPYTRFSLGSGNKMFTAIAVAQLVEKGKLNYFDPLSIFFPDFPDTAFAKKATVHHLLSHTSGVKEYWTEEYEKNRGKIGDTKQMLPWVYKVGTAFDPGSRFQYSNSNFILAGAIVERVSGIDYFSYIRKHIYEPLGMTITDSYFNDGSVGNLADPLKKGAQGWEAAEEGLRGSAAGGGYSTTQDILKFARGLVAGKLVSTETLSMLTTSKTRSMTAPFDYGYGFILGNEGSVRSYGHGGTAVGVNFEFRYFPQADITFVIFCNQENGAYDDLRKNIVRLITGDR